MSKTTIDTIAIFKGIATAHCGGLSALEVIKGHIASLREAGIKMGKSIKTCEYRVQCTDAYVLAFPKTAKKTISNYVTAVVDGVNNGTEFSFSASKGKSKGKKKSDADKTIFPILAKLFSHEGFAGFMEGLQEAYDDDKGSLADLIKDTLLADGYEISA